MPAILKRQLSSTWASISVIVDPSGHIVYSKAVDLSSETETPLPSGLETYVTGESLLARHTSVTSSVAGMLVLPEHPTITASQPILTSDKQGPIVGSLIMGRYLSPQEIQQLSEITDLSLELHQMDQSDLPADFETAKSDLSEDRTSLVRDFWTATPSLPMSSWPTSTATQPMC